MRTLGAFTASYIDTNAKKMTRLQFKIAKDYIPSSKLCWNHLPFCGQLSTGNDVPDDDGAEIPCHASCAAFAPPSVLLDHRARLHLRHHRHCRSSEKSPLPPDLYLLRSSGVRTITPVFRRRSQVFISSQIRDAVLLTIQFKYENQYASVLRLVRR